MPSRPACCPVCGDLLDVSSYDAAFRMPDGTELLCFAVPGSLCATCSQLYVEPDLIDALDLGEGRCIFAIESDTMLVERASS